MPGCACFQTCSGYLLQRGMDSRKILAHLRALTCRVSRAPQTLCATPGHGGRLPLFQFREVETPGQGSRETKARPVNNGGAWAAEAAPPGPHVHLSGAGRVLPSQVYQEEETIGLQHAFSVVKLDPSLAAAPQPHSDLVWLTGKSRLEAVQGPVPGQPSGLRGAELLPEALASPDTHSRPIVPTADAGVCRDRPTLTSGPAERPEDGGQLDLQGKEKPGVDSDELSQGNFEVGFRPQQSVKAGRDRQPEAQPQGGGLARGAEAESQPPRPPKHGLAVSPAPVGMPSCSPGWCSAFYEADCFGADVHSYVQELAGQKGPRDPVANAQSPELEQQLMIEKRNFRKTLKFYQKLLQKEKRNKGSLTGPGPGWGSEVKTMLSKLKGQLEEMRSKVVYAEQWGLEPCALPVIVSIAAAHCDTLDFSPLDESSSLIFYNVSKHPRGSRQPKARVLQAGTPLGLMAYLYSSGAFLEGYVQQFLYTFRYFCSPQDFLHFLLDRISSTLSRAHQEPTSTFTKIYRRSFCLLQAWLEDCYTVDFVRNAGLLGRLQDYLSSQILPLDGSAEHLLGLLEVGTERQAEGALHGTDLEDPKEVEGDARPLNALCKRLSEDAVSRKSFPWRLSRGSGPALPHKERQYSIASALPKPCFLEDFYGPYTKAGEKGPYFLTEYSTQQLFSQLTLLQQELFQKCHPVHFLNSRALGVTDKSAAVPKASSSESLSAKTCSLFLPNYVQDKYLLQLLRSADDVSTWVAAEIVTSHTSKLQVNLLSKFLLIAKSCYEQRNFATAMQILGGLEHAAVRQSPAWRILPAKIAEVMEELKAVEVPVCMSSRELSSPQGRRVMGGRTGCLAACLTAPTPRPPRTVYGLPVSPGAIPSPGQRRQGRSRSPVCRLCLTGERPSGPCRWPALGLTWVFLKSDSLCLMEGRRLRAQPTLPSAHLLAMHIQQLETGGFTMTNGAHRWSKLRNIAKVASQVHAFQENPYTFAPDPKLQSQLKQRIARFSGADIAVLAADSGAGPRQAASEKHSRKIQDKLRRMRATFQ
ncbi:hypothetical protein Celaphus_00008670 [Cervus elaphus hippelaphus]|uniref:KNDC1 n=1 Tax=Cervus elaphus hippelaphus TaxID=46360 RepID=A0A212CNS2_CEREH|nr:hypothetical protein Celaphus_00008670 [Cervus elaphus hippelaphus]